MTTVQGLLVNMTENKQSSNELENNKTLSSSALSDNVTSVDTKNIHNCGYTDKKKNHLKSMGQRNKKHPIKKKRLSTMHGLKDHKGPSKIKKGEILERKDNNLVLNNKRFTFIDGILTGVLIGSIGATLLGAP